MRRLILGVVMLLAAGPAAAVPLYEVDVLLAAASGGGYDDAEPPPLSNSSTVTFWERVSVSGATGYAAGAAGPGSVAAVAQAFYSVVDPTKMTCASSEVRARATIDDLIVWGTGVVNGLYLHMDLSGSISLLELGTTDWAGSKLLIDFPLDEKS